MSAVCLIDTTVFCNILAVPGRSQHKAVVGEELLVKVGNDESLLLPMATIFETGNHIAQSASGGARRASARRVS